MTELGTPLFLRLPRKLRLTAAGEIMIGHVRQTLREMKGVRRRIDELKGLRRGEITLAIMSGLAANVVPSVAADFRHAVPGENPSHAPATGWFRQARPKTFRQKVHRDSPLHFPRSALRCAA